VLLALHHQHPFAAGLTLAEFKAVSTDENWVEAFIHDAKAALHKVGVKSVPVKLDF
jgi:predicted DsbA family dithiol-disulfide isomerase